MKLTKAFKVVGKETQEELESLPEPGLKQRIVEANEAMRQVDSELDSNPKYQEIKENLKAITAGKKEVYARQNAVIAVALHLLNPGETQDE